MMSSTAFFDGLLPRHFSPVDTWLLFLRSTSFSRWVCRTYPAIRDNFGCQFVEDREKLLLESLDQGFIQAVFQSNSSANTIILPRGYANSTGKRGDGTIDRIHSEHHPDDTVFNRDTPCVWPPGPPPPRAPPSPPSRPAPPARGMGLTRAARDVLF